MIKILSVGNSFSQDAQKYLRQICASAGQEVSCANLFIGGCSIATHWQHAQDNESAYDYEFNGVTDRKISLPDALAAEDWDIITFQQASCECGIISSYAHLKELAAFVRERCPKAKFYIQQTWAFDDHPLFGDIYLGDQKAMYDCLTAAYEMAGRMISTPVIPVGTIIQTLRENEPFFADRWLTRDGFHLSLGYGRYAAALAWYGVMFDGDVKAVDFMPDDPEAEVLPEIIEKIKETVAEVLAAQ